jgi:hypothetical protein
MTEHASGRGRSGRRAGGGTDPPWIVRIFYDIAGLPLEGSLKQLHQESAELRARREGGEKGLTGNIKAIDAAIQAELLSVPASRRHAQHMVIVTMVLIVAILLVMATVVGVPLTWTTAGAISILASGGALGLRLRQRRLRDRCDEGEEHTPNVHVR